MYVRFTNSCGSVVHFAKGKSELKQIKTGHKFCLLLKTGKAVPVILLLSVKVFLTLIFSEITGSTTG